VMGLGMGLDTDESGGLEVGLKWYGLDYLGATGRAVARVKCWHWKLISE